MTQIVRRGKFARGSNAGTAECYLCHKMTQKGIVDDQAGLCDTCYEQCGLENEHQDGYHDEKSNPRCPMCAAEVIAVEPVEEPVQQTPTVRGSQTTKYSGGYVQHPVTGEWIYRTIDQVIARDYDSEPPTPKTTREARTPRTPRVSTPGVRTPRNAGETKADQIRTLIAAGELTVAQIAKEVGAHYSQVHGIAKSMKKES